MNKEEFNRLEVLEQIEYINKQIMYNKSITNVCKSIGVGRSTIRDRFKKVGYIFNKESNMYIVEQEYNICNTDIETLNNESSTFEKSTKNIKEEYKCCSVGVEILNDDSNKSTRSIKNIVEDKEGVLEVIEKGDEEIKNNLLELAKDYEVLKEMIDTYRRNTSVVEKQITINLEDADSKLTAFRVNSKVLEEFNKFCNNNKQFKKVDLLSQALKNFMEQHS